MKISLLIFDFDNTLEEFFPYEEAVENDIFQQLGAKYLIDPVKMRSVFDAVKLSYQHPRAEPRDYGRAVWFSETFHVFHIHEPVPDWVEYYWDRMFSLVRIWPGTFHVLEQLKEQYTLCILSDSDGDLQIKLKRIEQLGLTKFFDKIFTSDMAGHNKPNPRMFLQVLEHYKACAEECIMIGDSPNVDLAPAKELGMHTIWARQGAPKEIHNNHYEFVDHIADNVIDIPAAVSIIESRSEIRAAAPAPLPHVRN